MREDEQLIQAMACPWCNKRPDVTSDASFQFSSGGAEGAVVCCGTGPAVSTDRKPLAHWRDKAVLAWNNRPPSAEVNYDQKTKQILEKFEQLFSQHVAEIHAAYKKYLNNGHATDDAEYIRSLSPDQLMEPGYLAKLENEMKGWKKLPD